MMSETTNSTEVWAIGHNL